MTSAFPRRTIQIDAWPGRTASSKADPESDWAIGGLTRPQEPLAFDKPIDPLDWRQSGYGILVPDDAAGTWKKQKVTGSRLPAPLRRLLAARPDAVLLHWSPLQGDTHVRRYFADGGTSDLAIGLTATGTGVDMLPKFVLIAATPATIPWRVQYALSLLHFVGRLPFDGKESGPYIDAMLDGDDGWRSTPTTASSAAVWTVDHGKRDITRLMRTALTQPLVEKYDGTVGNLATSDEDASTGDALLAALKQKPGVVVTSSHGATPLEPDELAGTMGLPVDASHTPVPLDDLVTEMPAGAVWFAQACCSAGSSSESSYSDLLEEGTTARIVVDAVTGPTSTVAPAPLAMLARDKPVRAVLGHVEPTFDATLEDADTGQLFGHGLVTALSSRLFSGMAIGGILADYYAGVMPLLKRHQDLVTEFLDDNDDALLPALTRLRLISMDRQSLVLLGDPTVAIAALV
jgi:hypothetical protein